MISPEIRAQIRRYFYAEHWKIGTIARELGVHPDTVRNAIEAQRFNAQPLRTSMADPYLAFIRQTLDQHPRLRATRIYQMVRDVVTPAAWSNCGALWPACVPRSASRSCVWKPFLASIMVSPASW
jgi:IS30 family transposase